MSNTFLYTGVALTNGNKYGLIFNMEEEQINYDTLENKAMPLLVNHDPDRHIGKVEKLYYQDNKLMCDFRLSQSATQIKTKIDEGIINKLSLSLVNVKYNDKKEVVGFRPFELSLTSTPRDVLTNFKEIKEIKEEEEKDKENEINNNNNLEDKIQMTIGNIKKEEVKLSIPEVKLSTPDAETEVETEVEQNTPEVELSIPEVEQSTPEVEQNIPAVKFKLKRLANSVPMQSNLDHISEKLQNSKYATEIQCNIISESKAGAGEEYKLQPSIKYAQIQVPIDYTSLLKRCSLFKISEKFKLIDSSLDGTSVVIEDDVHTFADSTFASKSQTSIDLSIGSQVKVSWKGLSNKRLMKDIFSHINKNMMMRLDKLLLLGQPNSSFKGIIEAHKALSGSSKLEILNLEIGDTAPEGKKFLPNFYTLSHKLNYGLGVDLFMSPDTLGRLNGKAVFAGSDVDLVTFLERNKYGGTVIVSDAIPKGDIWLINPKQYKVGMYNRSLSYKFIDSSAQSTSIIDALLDFSIGFQDLPIHVGRMTLKSA